MFSRRKILLTLAASPLVAALSALAQQPARVRRIGYLGGGSARNDAPYLAAFRRGMTELRWVEVRDYLIDSRYGNGDSQAMAGLAAELVAAEPDLVLVPTDAIVPVISARSQTLPIVFAFARDPVGLGFAASLRRPGGNVTGLTSLIEGMSAKRLQLLKEAFPRIVHVAMLFEPADVTSGFQVKEIQEAAKLLALRVTPLELRLAADIEPAFKRGAALGVHAYIVTSGVITNNQRQAIADRVFRARVPAMYGNAVSPEAGGLMSYGVSFEDNFRRAAAFVDKILKGARPGDLPIEQPTRFEMVVNMKTAKAMGFTIPQSILLRADRVIE